MVSLPPLLSGFSERTPRTAESVVDHTENLPDFLIEEDSFSCASATWKNARHWYQCGAKGRRKVGGVIPPSASQRKRNRAALYFNTRVQGNLIADRTREDLR